MTRTPTDLRVVLDVNVLLDALYALGPVTCLDEIADMQIPNRHISTHALTVVKSIAGAARNGVAEFTVHVAPHVWSMTARKLVRPSNPQQQAWTVEEARTAMRVLYAAFQSMTGHGWTIDAQRELSRRNLATVVPRAFYGGRYDIDDEDRSVLLGLVAAAELEARDERPVLTVLITNDGGLQLADGYVAQKYQSTQGRHLPASVKIMFPKQMSPLLSNMASTALVAA